jgi:hypothetical protein
MLLSNGCASFALGTRRGCDAPVIPIRPDSEVCLWNTDGSLSCYDNRRNPPKYGRTLTMEDIVVNINDYNAHEKWEKDILEACR